MPVQTAGQTPSPRLRTAWQLLGVIAVVALAIVAIGAAAVLFRAERRSVNDRRAELAAATAGDVRAVLDAVDGALVGASALVDEDGAIDRQRFETFGEEALDATGATAVALERRISADERDDIENELGQPIEDLDAGGSFVTAPIRPAYCPIIDVVSRRPEPQAVVSFDPCGDVTRAPVRQQAADTRDVAVSPVVAGVPDGRAAIFVVRPLVTPGTSDVAGFITAGYVVDDLVEATAAGLPAGAVLHITDDGTQVFGPVDVRGASGVAEVDVLSRAWRVEVAGGIERDNGPAWLVLVGGLALAALVAAVLVRRARYEASIERLGATRGRQAERSSAVAGLAEALATALGRDDVRVAIAQKVPSAVGAQFAALGILEGPQLVVTVGDGLAADLQDRYAAIPLVAPNPMTDVIRSGRPLLLADRQAYAAAYPAMAADLSASGTAATAVHLLRNGRGETIGTLGVAWSAPVVFDDDLRATLLTVAGLAAQTLERADLTDAIARNARRASVRAAVTTAVSATDDERSVADALLRTLRDELGGTAGAAAKLDTRTGAVEVLATDGDPELVTGWHEDEPASTGTARLGSGHLIVRRWGPFDAEHSRVELDDAASSAAAAIDATRVRDMERTLAVRLQRTLLALDVTTPGIVVAARYRAADEPLRVGGDWYDAIALPNGRVGVVAGDVVGHGVAAAVVMAQLRSALASAALQATTPCAALATLDRFVTRTPGAACSTVAYAVVDPTRCVVEYCLAGHPPPLLIEPDGSARLLDDGRRILLLTHQPSVAAESATAEFVHGSTLILYTDGLVERRDEPLDDGFNRLVRAATFHAALPTGALCDALVQTLAGDRDRTDDIAIVALRLVASTPTIHVDTFASAKDQFAPARDRLRTWLDRIGAPEATAADIVLATNEAWTNAAAHGNQWRSERLVRVEAGLSHGTVVVAVSDSGQWRPPVSVNTEEQRNRGHAIMATLADDVTTEPDDRGTTVTLRFSL